MANLDKGAVQTGGLDKGAVQHAATPVATWAAALDTNISIDVTAANVRKRLRVEIQNTGVASSGSSFKWQYRKNSGSWSDITASSSDVKTFDSTYFSDGDDCSQLLGAGTYQADNNAAEDSSGAFSLTAGLAAATAFESEIALEFIKADLVDTDVLEFRIVTAAGALDTYSAIPQATIIETLATVSAVGTVTVSAAVQAAAKTLALAGGSCVAVASAQAVSKIILAAVGSSAAQAVVSAAAFARQRISFVGNVAVSAAVIAGGVDANAEPVAFGQVTMYRDSRRR